MPNKKITLLFDANPLVSSRKSGVGYYTKGVIEALAHNYPNELELVGHYFNFLGRIHNPSLPTAPNIRYRQSRYLHPKVLSLLRRIGLQLPFDPLIKERGDVAFFPNFVSLPMLRKIPSIVTIHDLTFLDSPEYLQPANRAFLTRFVPRSLRSAAVVVAISEATKQSAIHYFGLDESRFVVTPIPVTPMPHGLPTPQGITGKYILFMSTLEPRKNFMTLVRAYVALPPAIKQTYSLVLAGGEGWNVSESMVEIHQLQAQGEKIVTTGYVDESTRAALYEHADLFVMPSFLEGFGMTLLEAMSYNVPVVASDIPVFHEVAGTAAVYADPHNIPAFTTAMGRVLASPDVSAQLKTQGQKQLATFSWEAVAKSLYEAILRVSNKS